MAEEKITEEKITSSELTGESPDKKIREKLKDAGDKRLLGAWSMLGNGNPILYEAGTPNMEVLDAFFSGEFSMTYDVLEAIGGRYLNGFTVKVRQIRDDNCCQSRSNIVEVINTVKNPEIIITAGSRFLAVLADADYGLDLWIWDLKMTKK